MQKTMTEGSEWKLILLFTLPLMAGNLLQQLYNTVDGIIVGNFVSENALAAVGTCSPLTLLFVAIALGMSNGAAVVVSQLFGARRLDEMKRSVATSLLLLFWMGLGFSVLGMLSAKWLLRSVLGVQGYLLDDAVLYFRVYAAGLLFQFVYNIAFAGRQPRYALFSAHLLPVQCRARSGSRTGVPTGRSGRGTGHGAVSAGVGSGQPSLYVPPLSRSAFCQGRVPL